MPENQVTPEIKKQVTAVPESDPPSESERKVWYARVLDVLGEITHIVIISLAIIVPIRYFLIQPFYVKGASMEPNFYDHEYLIIDELSYRFKPVQRGDVVVFRYPNDPRQYFIKRVIALPGESVKVADGRVTIFNAEHPEGLSLDEKAYLGSLRTSGDEEIKLGTNEYFLLGDNRTASLDSRIFGPVSDALIVGRVWLRGWPPERIALFPSMPESAPKTSQ